MARWLGRRVGASAVLITSLVAAFAAPATADAALRLQLPNLLGGGVPQSPGPVPPPATLNGFLSQVSGATSALLTNRIGVGTTAETVACPGARNLEEAAQPLPGLSEAAQAARFAACALHFLDFEWRTDYDGPGNPLTDDRIVTTLAVPTPLNLDSDPLPEALGIVLPLGPNQFQLSFSRLDLLGLEGKLPSLAELIVTDPTGNSLPRPKIGVGVDARNGGRFPAYIGLKFTLESYRPPIGFGGPPRFRIDIDTTMPQNDRVAIFGDLFDESPGGAIRDSMIRGEVGMQPVPKRLTARVAMRADNGIDADLQTSHPTNLDVTATVNGDRDTAGARRVQRIGANLYALPQSTTVKFRPIAPSTAPAGATAEQRDKARGGQTVQYTSATPLGGLDASYDDVTRPASGPDIPLIRGRLRVRDLPTQMSVSQLGSFTDFSASGTGIGSIEAEFALNSDLIARRTPRPGVRFVRGTTNAQGKQPLAIAARIDGVRRVAMDNLEGRTVLDVGIKRQPFDVDMTDAPGGMTAEAQIEDLPADAKVQFLPARPATDDGAAAEPEPLRVRYDAGGHAIGRIGYKATFAEAIGGAVNQIEGHLTELPPAIDVTAALEDEIYEFNASKPFGEIEALARNTKAVQANTQPELTAGSTGVSAVVRDNGPLAARARLIGLKNVNADLGEQRYHVEIGAVPFEARALVDEVRDGEVLARELLGTIDQLPASVDVAFKKQDGQQVIIYKGAPGVGKLALELRGDKLYAPQPKVNRVRAAVFGVPEEIALTLGAAGKLEFDAGPGISKIEGLVTSGPDPAFPADRHAAYVETGADIVAKVQLLGFKKFKFDPDPLDVTFETAQSLPLDVDAKLDLDGNGVAEMTGALDIRNVPAAMRAQLEEDGSATYDGSTEIDSIDVTASGLPDVPALPVKLHSVSVGVDSVPRHIEAGYGDEGRIQFRGEDETGALDAVGAVEVGAATASPPALPTGLADSHIAFRHAGQQLAGRVRLAGLREIDVKPSPLDVTLDTDVLQELDVNAASDAGNDGTNEKTLTAQVRSNITRLTLKDELAASGRRIVADTGTPLGSLNVNAKADNLPLGINTVALSLLGLPEVIHVGFPSNTDVIDVDLLRRDGDGNLVKDGNGLDELRLAVNGGTTTTSIVNRHGQTVTGTDGLTVDKQGSNIVKAALVLHGLRGASFGTSPHTQVGLDVAQSQAKPLALDVKLDDKTAVGHIDKLPENLKLELSPVSDVPVRYSADQEISEISVATTFIKDLFPLVRLKLLDLPKQFSICFRSDSTRASCIRDGNRFATRTNRRFSAGYTSSKTATDAATTIDADACFASTAVPATRSRST